MNEFLTYFRTSPTASSTINVDKERSVLLGVSVVEIGEAKGHGLSIELSFLKDLIKLSRKQNGGVKSNYDHPSSYNSGFGNFAGNVVNFRLSEDETKVLADINLDQEIGKAANKEKYNYAMLMAEKYPNKIGMSIAFQAGWPYQYDEDGKRINYRVKAKSGEYVRHKSWSWDRKVYATINGLDAVDFVDEPAATSGLFSVGSDDIKTYFENKKMTEMSANKDISLTPEEKSGLQKLFAKWGFGKKGETTPPVEDTPPIDEAAPVDFDSKLEALETKLQAKFEAQQEKHNAEKIDLEKKLSTAQDVVIDLKTQLSQTKVDAGNGGGDNLDNGNQPGAEAVWQFSQWEIDEMKRNGVDPVIAGKAFSKGITYEEAKALK